jgi:DNA-binding response OmpR family regulator
MNKILLVDDDVELLEMLTEYLEQDNFDVTQRYSGISALEAIATKQFQLVVLDVMMPGMNGIETLRQIRLTSRIPAMMLTARGDDIDRIIGLELGADDYVAKPCTPRELAARIRAILRRSHAHETETQSTPLIRVGQLTMNNSLRRTYWGEQALELTSTEFILLEILVKNVGRTISKNTLSELGLGRPLTRFDRNIDVHLSSIRQKLGLLNNGQTQIQTVYKQGYVYLNE